MKRALKSPEKALPEIDDALLRRVRRSIAKAQKLTAEDCDRRRVLVMMVEIRENIGLLRERLDSVEQELKASTRRVVAVNAYNRCAVIGQRVPSARSPEAKS
jgi:hypothetical protein